MSGNVSEYDNIPTIRIKKKTQRVDVITGFAFNIILYCDTLREAWDVRNHAPLYFLSRSYIQRKRPIVQILMCHFLGAYNCAYNLSTVCTPFLW